MGNPTWRANAVLLDEAQGALVDLTVAEAAAAGTTLTVDLFLAGWACTVDGQPEVADVVRLQSARVVGTFTYTCTEDTGGGQGLAPGALDGTLSLDVAWTGVGPAIEQPLFDGAVGRYVVREAVVTAEASMAGDVSSRLEANAGHLARESTVIPPGRLR
ncbi:hypothetical protein E9529_02700 [Blastococcus sp. KM273128]|uniref:hypothetical protein n=1 Tax=Blastococcus sp. KM273128 TaxID=2570314 RepID=UPI001F46737E|nr:hypothetical protein [Blastococcus sp. KM273128]MCF6743196.1 hypothetical protein [Blastococcus sp. KM273128]